MSIKTNAKKVAKLSAERLHNILLAPHISEKATRISEKYRQVVFKVLKDATKGEIKLAVEKLFEVKVEGVNISNNHPKVRNFKQLPGRHKQVKKAYVRLAEGCKIDFASEE